ncbi:hypothetical protein [Undibacterium umbellatum]|uniref:Lipoprotein n=1 Tax=Undibacterium umbellatum TaxID=2762300 RepID=A0ABR6ZDF6_9BURK|nr:hypothetical protein [Undibacterium umbellatum]MBC3909786.1 hypothetical protein [Undibacterium umbellatum]
MKTSIQKTERVAALKLNKTVYGASLMVALSLLSACQSAPRASSIRAATPAEMAIVQQEWIDKKCNVGLGEVKFIACATVAANQMPAFDINKREQFGDRYNPKEWLECMKRSAERGGRGDGVCDPYKLRRQTDPEYWPNPEILPVKWPKATEVPKKPDGLSDLEYFHWLCKHEAGEVIYKTVDKVEGVYEIRPIHEPSDQEYEDKYVLEDPYSTTRGMSTVLWKVYVQPKLGKYQFLEMVTPSISQSIFVSGINKNLDFRNLKSKYVRFFRDENSHPEDRGAMEPNIVNAEPAEQLQARYGFTWRGVGGSKLREHGISGGEQIVLDLQTGEVLAWRRSFVRSTKIWWMTAMHCSQEMTNPTDMFVKRVLKPIHAPK